MNQPESLKMSSTDAQQKLAWVTFPEKNALLKRLVAPGDLKGVLLRVAENAEGEKVRKAALEMGFKEMPTRSLLRFVTRDGRMPFTARQLAANLGGKLIAVTREEMLSSAHTVVLSARAPDTKKEAAVKEEPKILQPDPAGIQTLGLNARGEEVVFDHQGRFYRAVNKEDGTSRFVHEGEGDRASLFLRAEKPEDLESIGSALIAMARRGTIHSDDFTRIVGAALEEGPGGQLDIGRDAAEDAVRQHMLREITAIAVEGDASRERFQVALRVADAARFVLSRRDQGDGFSPSPAMAAFLRRMVRGNTQVDFRGSPDLRIALPRVLSTEADLQVHDLGTVPASGVHEYAANILARRNAAGSTILMVPAIGEDEFERLRSEIGRAYSLESVARVAASVADGFQDGTDLIVMFIGEKRPEPLDALPQAALRDFQVVTSADLMNLERDILRAKAKIRDFHNGVEKAAQEIEDSREENIRQRPYQPLSQISEPFTMIPLALEGATARALGRVRQMFAERGGADAVVASALGESLDSIGEVLNAEQVDAVAAQLAAAERGRGMLIADQTGIGKGRELAAIARAWLRAAPGNKVLYLTESARINVPDVCRDLVDVGAWPNINPMLLTSGSTYSYLEMDAETGEEKLVELTSPKPSVRKAIFDGGAWPEGHDIIISNYSQFRSGSDKPTTQWLQTALGPDVMLIMDEAHNALNENSMQGKNIRSAIEAIGAPQNIVFGTATPTRDPSGLSLYAPLLPNMGGQEAELLSNLRSGGEVAQESFATMLADDGVMLRRDHDLSNIEFKVELPSDDVMLRYQQIMDKFSPVVEMMIDANIRIGDRMDRVQAVAYREMVRNGLSEESARARTNAMNQYSIALGSPLSNLSRLAMNAVKASSVMQNSVSQIVDVTLREIEEGRKPMITFHSTNEALLKELLRGPDGKLDPELLEETIGLSIRDQILRIHETMYRTKIDGEIVDSRDIYPDVAETSERIRAAIMEMDELAASPVDMIIEQLEEQGLSVGEVSGRNYAYRNGQIQRRSSSQKDKRGVIDGYNEGDIDVILFNAAGATGGSMHASPKFKDQRPRSIIEFEAPLDIIKYVQGLGRGNRFGQLHRPRVISVMTGLIPEMRIMQQRNRKLRALGASVDGNRSHPMLLEDVPDLLNSVGDEATRIFLSSNPATARRLGFPEYAEADQQVTGFGQENDAGSGALIGSGAESLSNKVMTRALVLDAPGQADMAQRIVMEFDALIEELESRNANPLRPRELEGHVDILDTSLYSGEEQAAGDLNRSAFNSALYVLTGRHHYDEAAWDGDKLVTEIESVRRLYGTDGFRPYAERIRQNMPALLRVDLPEGMSIEEAMADPRAAGHRFEKRYNMLGDLAWLLENLQPGVAIRFPTVFDKEGTMRRTVVGLVPPANPAHYYLPSAYKIRTIVPGSGKPETTSLSRCLSGKTEKIIFRPGLSERFDEDYLRDFDNDRMFHREVPVQILTGNIIQAINEASRHNLGSVTLFRDEDGQVHRGVVVKDLNLSLLPAQVPSARVAALAQAKFFENQGNVASFRFWGNYDNSTIVERDKCDIDIFVTARRADVSFPPLRRTTEAFYRSRPGLYELVWSEPFPDKVPERASRRSLSRIPKIDVTDDAGKERLRQIMWRLEGINLMTQGRSRPFINAAVAELANAGIAADGTDLAAAPFQLQEIGADAATPAGPRAGEAVRQAPRGDIVSVGEDAFSIEGLPDELPDPEVAEPAAEFEELDDSDFEFDA